jgi:autotransporter-associated beta strand protein
LYNGSTTVSDGVLELGGAGRFNAGSYSNEVSLSSASSVLRIATSANQTLSGAISGSGSLAKSGAGTLTLSGSNSYTGNTAISGGTLIASHANAFGDAASAVTVSSGATLTLNANMTRTGTVTFDAANLNGGPATLTNNGGGYVVTNACSIAGSVALAGSGGLTVLSGQTYFWSSGHTYTGPTVIAVNGDLVLAGGGAISANSSVDNSWLLRVGNMNHTIAGLTGASTGRIIGNASYTLTVNKVSGTDTYGGTIESVSSFVKAGAGTLILTGASTYTGATIVSNGTLQVNAPGSLHAASAVSVQSGGTLGGSGTVKGAVTVTAGGALAPGASVGTLTVSTNVVLAGTLRVEVDGNGAGSADKLAVSGTLDITNATVDFDVLATADDLVYVIASYGTLAGTQFANVADLPAGYRLDYNLNGLKQIALKKVIGTLIRVF